MQQINTAKIKAISYQDFMNSSEGKKQIDIVFTTILKYQPVTDRETHKIMMDNGYFIPVGQIPARRKNITEDTGKYKNFEVIPTQKRKCRVTGKRKSAWEIRNVKKRELNLFN